MSAKPRYGEKTNKSGSAFCILKILHVNSSDRFQPSRSVYSIVHKHIDLDQNK